jgi:hypothetical protein
MQKIIFLLFLLMPMISKAEDPSWDQIKKLEITYQVLGAVDTAQTLYFLHNGTARELNPLLGSDPPVGKVIVFKAIAGVLHYAVTRKIYEYNPEYAKYFEYTSIAVQGAVVGLNFRYVF